jgi:hypothetical protein
MRIFLVAAALAAISAPAFAADQWTATPAQPVTKSDLIGELVSWDCTASGCAAQSSTDNADAMSECVGLARHVGPFTAFVGSNGPLDASRLARCNQAAPKPKS